MAANTIRSMVPQRLKPSKTTHSHGKGAVHNERGGVPTFQTLGNEARIATPYHSGKEPFLNSKLLRIYPNCKIMHDSLTDPIFSN